MSNLQGTSLDAATFRLLLQGRIASTLHTSQRAQNTWRRSTVSTVVGWSPGCLSSSLSRSFARPGHRG
ncbi:unnamed protein product [Linum trigynum]|uniref:Uncharacterized protein n=1 Tax=Linum trigynum TaxID=586398 RepID=A0AAV2DQH2_9ROSI